LDQAALKLGYNLKVPLEVDEGPGGAMKGLAVSALDEAQMLQTRGW